MNQYVNYSFLDMESLRMSSAMFGRMFATGAYYICLQYASEIFPTSIRGSGLSLCEIIGGIGLFMSPWIVYLVSMNNLTKIVLVFLYKIIILYILYFQSLIIFLSFQAKFQTELPLLVFGAISIFGSLATFFLPETCNKDLPSNIDAANNFEVNQKYLDCILCSKQREDNEDLEKGDKEEPLLIPAKVVECENLDSISLRRSLLELTITT